MSSMAEIQRKAREGIALTHPTPEKQAIYDSYRPSAPAVSVGVSGGGGGGGGGGGIRLDPSNPHSYLNDLARRLADPSYDAGRASPQGIMGEMARVIGATGTNWMPAFNQGVRDVPQVPIPQLQIPQVPVLGYGEASRQAMQQLRPVHDMQLSDMLRRSVARQDARGIGQSSLGEQVDLGIEKDMSAHLQSSAAAMAQQMVGQSQQHASSAADRAIQQYMAQMHGWQAGQDQQHRQQQYERQDKMDNFGMMMQMKQFGLEEIKVKLAEQDQNFREWTTRQGVELDWSKLDLQKQSLIVDKYLAERGQNMSSGTQYARMEHDTRENALDRELKRELAGGGGGDSGATREWMMLLDESISNGDIKTYGDYLEVIGKEADNLQREGVDIQQLNKYATDRLVAANR